jgi:CubicO group peptidase (beta-lactamase class C family)
MDRAKFDQLVRQIASESDENAKGVGIDAVAISSPSGHYEHAFTRCGGELHELRSLSKLVVSLCIGVTIASKRFVVDDGLLDLDTHIWSAFKDKISLDSLRNVERLGMVTVKDLLTQRVGFSSSEVMSSSWRERRNSDDLLGIILNEPIEVEPGREFVYSNASAFLLSAFFQEVTGESLYEAAQRILFAPLGIKEHAWTSFGAYSAGATGLYLLIADVQKLGRLMLQNGWWQGREIVPEWFVNAMIAEHVHLVDERWRNHVLAPHGYGFLVWINRDGYYASGAKGQYLLVEPQKEIVVSVLSNREILGGLLDSIRAAARSE